ncbi:hypothetical protein [Streptomyces sp. 1114.5]|nr:hypothetical protein [Streptomyces sp. 1114.5]
MIITTLCSSASSFARTNWMRPSFMAVILTDGRAVREALCLAPHARWDGC